MYICQKVTRMNENIYYSKEEALSKVFELVKPSNLDKKTYKQFSDYRRLHRNGELGVKATQTLLNHFGFKQADMWYKEKEKPTNQT